MSSDENTEIKMVPEGIATVQRGEQTRKFKLLGHEWQVKIRVMTNDEVDNFQKEFLDLQGADIDSAGLAEARLINGLIEINTTFGGHPWSTLSEYAKRTAAQEMHPRLRERIGEEIFGHTHFSTQEANF